VSLRGTGALAMWWDVSRDVLAEFEDWHSHEHFPERIAIPGFNRASRWTQSADGEGIFVLYEVESHATLSSPAYLARLNAPTPWSTKMMPHHRNMVRAQCHVLASRGGAIGRHALTLRFPLATEESAQAQSRLASLVSEHASRPGLIGAHLLRHEMPDIAATTEQRIRGLADRTAEWILVAIGYQLPELEALAESIAADATLQRCFGDAPTSGLYALSHSATPSDVA
jgi:hypothetical protein